MNKIKEFFKSIKEFLTRAGLTKVIYLILAVYFWLTGAAFFTGVTFGIFIYINFNVLAKIIKESFPKDKKLK